jgi:hypothetical protein
MELKTMKKLKKVVFQEDINKSKCVFGYVEDLDENFIVVTTESGTVFTINKRNISFIKEGGY